MKSGTPFVDLVGPFYFKEEGTVVAIGIRLEPRHCDSAGTPHGGMLATMADVALGNSIGHASIADEEREQWRADGHALKRAPAPMVTVSMTTDFAGFARVGDWVEVHANAYLERDGDRFARASGVYRNLSQR